MIRIFALCGGYLELAFESMIRDAPPSRWTVPIECFLVEHPRGRLLFDTGLHCDTLTKMRERYGKERARRFGARSQPGDDIVSQLARVGVPPGAVPFVANSHWHFDHCGGNEFFPQATILVQKREMDAARSAEVLAQGRYRPSPVDYEHPLRYHAVDGEHDVFGDGRVLLIPTYGHTPGHQSLLVDLPQTGPVLLTGDACYWMEHAEKERVPGVVWNPTLALHALKKIKTVARLVGARLFPGHDPEFWKTVIQAPNAYR
jgi:glyoxylase-like metal-dependent hydrolase (beta-lactamase superfamily II)